MSQWYMADKNDGRPIGPVSGAQLKQLVSANRLLPTDLVMPVGGAEWVPASSIKGLFPAGAPEGTSAGPRRPATGGMGSFGAGAAVGLTLGILIGAGAAYLILGTHANPPTAIAQAAPDTHSAVAPAHEPRIVVTPEDPQPPAPPSPTLPKDTKPTTPPPEKEARPPSPPPPDKEAKPPPPLVPPPAPVIPPAEKLPAEQLELIKQVGVFAQRFAEAPNELVKDGLPEERDAALRKTLPNRHMDNWVGTLKSLRVANTNLDVEITVQLAGAKSIGVRTMEVGTSDGQHFETLIRHGTPVHEQVSSLKPGDRIVFSGEFVSGGKRYLNEVSRTISTDIFGRQQENHSIAMSMKQPVFMFHFSRIAKE